MELKIKLEGKFPKEWKQFTINSNDHTLDELKNMQYEQEQLIDQMYKNDFNTDLCINHLNFAFEVTKDHMDEFFKDNSLDLRGIDKFLTTMKVLDMSLTCQFLKAYSMNNAIIEINPGIEVEKANEQLTQIKSL